MDVQGSKEVLTLLLTAPESQFDESMVNRLRKLLNSDPSADELRLGLKDILDLSVHCALASGFVMKILDREWQRLGGKAGDPVSKEVLRLTGR